MNTDTTTPLPTDQARVVCKTCRLGTLSAVAMQTATVTVNVYLGFPCSVCGSWHTCPVSPDGVHSFIFAAGRPDVDFYADQQPIFGCVHCGTRYAFVPLPRPTVPEHHRDALEDHEVGRVH